MTPHNHTEIDTGSGPIPVHEWGSTDTEAPGILLLQEIFGVSDYIKQRAADLHILGYYVLVPPSGAWTAPSSTSPRPSCCSVRWALSGGSTGTRR